MLDCIFNLYGHEFGIITYMLSVINSISIAVYSPSIVIGGKFPSVRQRRGNMMCPSRRNMVGRNGISLCSVSVTPYIQTKIDRGNNMIFE